MYEIPISKLWEKKHYADERIPVEENVKVTVQIQKFFQAAR